MTWLEASVVIREAIERGQSRPATAGGTALIDPGGLFGAGSNLSD